MYKIFLFSLPFLGGALLLLGFFIKGRLEVAAHRDELQKQNIDENK